MNVLQQYIYTHITFVIKTILESIPSEEVTDSLFRTKLTEYRGNIISYKIPSGNTIENASSTSLLHLISILHLFYPRETDLSESYLEFIRDFILPGGERVPLSESDNDYPELSNALTNIFNKPQDLNIQKKFFGVYDSLLSSYELLKATDKSKLSKFIIRLKFFAI